MLAGIMAVSMLAGCKDAASSSEPTKPETPVVGGYTATIYDLTKGGTKSVLKTKDNAALSAAFDAAEKVYLPAYLSAFQTTNGTLNRLGDTDTNGSKQLYDAMKSLTSADWDIDDDFDVMESTSKNADKVYVSLYYTGDTMNDTKLNGLVADEVDRLMGSVKDNTVGSDTVNYYLTVDRFTAGSGEDTVNIIMIAIERKTDKASA